MQPEEFRLADVKAWLSRAADDLLAAEHDMKAGERLFGEAAFHCQQAAEKAMKALLTWHDRPFRRTHNLEELGRQIAQLDANLAPLVDAAVVLTEYAWAYRYPGGVPQPALEEAQEALRTAHALVDAVLKRLPADARPGPTDNA